MIEIFYEFYIMRKSHVKNKAKKILSFNIRLNQAILLFQNYFDLRSRVSKYTKWRFSL